MSFPDDGIGFLALMKHLRHLRHEWLSALVSAERQRLLKATGSEAKTQGLATFWSRLNCWFWLAALLIGSGVLATINRLSFLPTREPAISLLEVLLQAHAAFAALSFVIVVLLIESVQRMEFSELIWKRFAELARLRNRGITVFGTLGVEALALGIMQPRPQGSPLPELEGTANLLLIGYVGIIYTVIVAIDLFRRVFDILQAETRLHMLQRAMQDEVREQTKKDIDARLARRLLTSRLQQAGIVSTGVSSVPPRWAPVVSGANGVVTDICLTCIVQLNQTHPLFLAVSLGSRVTVNSTNVGYLQRTDSNSAQLLNDALRVEQNR